MGKMDNTLKKYVFRAARELYPDMNPRRTAEWDATITAEQLDSSCKNGNKSYRDTFNRLKKAAKLPDGKTHTLGKFPPRSLLRTKYRFWSNDSYAK